MNSGIVVALIVVMVTATGIVWYCCVPARNGDYVPHPTFTV